MKLQTRTVRTVDVKLGPGRETLRVTLTTGEDGKPEALVLASGFGGANSNSPFLRPDWGSSPLTLPASVLPLLREALDALEERNLNPEDIEVC